MSSGFRNAPTPVKEFVYDKTKVKIYGGWGTIGGNCIVIEDPSLKVMLDQGVNFSQLKKFYGFFIQPESVEELRGMGILPPREAYEGVEEIYITHLHLDHLGSLNIPKDIPTYLPSKGVTEILARTWWFGWRQHLLPKTQTFYGFKDIEESNRVRACRVSHSAFPSYALRIDTDDLSILYTGDLRRVPLHSVGGDTLENLKNVAEGGVDVLVIEGTNFGRRMNYLNVDQFDGILDEVLSSYEERVLLLSVHPLDFEATLKVLEMLWKYEYTPTFENPYYALLLDHLLCTEGLELENEIFFTPRSSKVPHLDNFEIAFLEELKDRKVAFFLSPYGVKDISYILKVLGLQDEGHLHLTVLGEPLSEEWIIEERKVEIWLKLLGITSYRIHLSGHYYPHEFKRMIHAIKPKSIIPIHTKAPSVMLVLFEKYRK